MGYFLKQVGNKMAVDLSLYIEELRGLLGDVRTAVESTLLVYSFTFLCGRRCGQNINGTASR